MLLFTLISSAQMQEGARAGGLAGTAVTLGDVWSVYHNQAGLTNISSLQAGVYYQNRFALKELGDKGVTVAAKLGAGTMGFSYRSFGYTNFSQSKAGLAYALPLSPKFSIGVQMNYYAIRIAEGYGRSNAIGVEGGFLYKLNNKLTLGGHISNPTRAKLADYNDERIPSVLKVGATYSFSEKVQLIGQIQQTTAQKVVGSGAIEYSIVDAFVVRCGVASNPTLTAFGFGWKNKFLRADFSSSYHSVLGFSPQVSLVYAPAGL